MAPGVIQTVFTRKIETANFKLSSKNNHKTLPSSGRMA